MAKHFKLTLLITVVITAFFSCAKKDAPAPHPGNQVSVRINSAAAEIERSKTLVLEAEVQNPDHLSLTYSWAIGDSVIGNTQKLDFVSLKEGQFAITINVLNNNKSVASAKVDVKVIAEKIAYSPYVTKVFEYMPAPGQFVNTMPKYEPGDNAATMAKKATELIANNNLGMISLGGYGGYIVAGFDHTIVNVPGADDFKILGNAFWAAANPNPNAPERGGSCEPGIVMVSVDANKNGLPDDEWYELAGSEYSKTSTIKNYQITYYKPDEDKIRTPDNSYPYLNDTTYVKWTTNGYGSGYVYRNTFHNQSYWPQWYPSGELKFTGTKLADNYVDESGNGSYYVQYSYPWGYVDNAPNTDPVSNFRIEWAVDKNGNPIHLTGIDFIKIYTGVNQYCGWLGETSTEVMGINDLHLLN